MGLRMTDLVVPMNPAQWIIPGLRNPVLIPVPIEFPSRRLYASAYFLCIKGTARASLARGRGLPFITPLVEKCSKLVRPKMFTKMTISSANGAVLVHAMACASEEVLCYFVLLGGGLYMDIVERCFLVAAATSFLLLVGTLTFALMPG